MKKYNWKLAHLYVSFFGKNRITYSIGKKAFYSDSVFEKVGNLLLLLLLLLFVPLLNLLSRLEINSIHKNKDIFVPSKFNSKFYLPTLSMTEGEFIERMIFINQGYFEIDVLRKISDYILPNMRILDIGANVGNHTLYFLNEKKADFVTCFEPVPETFELLKKHIEINGLENKTRLIKAACGSENSCGRVVHVDENNINNQVLVDSEGDMEIVALDTLSDLGKVDFIKMDVEGFELNALKGMTHLLQEQSPVLFIEMHDDKLEADHEFLASIGYVQKAKVSFEDYIYIKKI